MDRRAAGAAVIHARGTIGHATESEATPEWNTTEIPSTVHGKYCARYSRVRSSECRTRSTSSAWVDSCLARNDGDADSTHTTCLTFDPSAGADPRGQAITGTRSEAIAAISSDARSNSSSDSTGVPSNGSSRVSSSHDRQPPYSSRTFTVTGRGIR